MRAAAVAPLVLAVAVAASGCGTGGPVKSGDATRGKTLFASNCAGCHALADAGSSATIGPNLDDAFAAMRPPGEDTHFSESTIRNAVLDQIRVAAPPMPQNLVKGQEAADVAAYVASVAGLRSAGGASATGGTGSTGGGSTSTTGSTGTTGATGTTGGASGGGASAATADGKSVFTANCSTCHTLAAANASGTVGPNLDKLKPDEARVKRQVENGGAVMPAFKGRLSAAQIAAVAKFVASAAGKK